MTREWNGSQVMGEFAKIAAESGLITTDFDKPIVGNSDKSPVGPFRNNPSVSGKTDTLSVDSNSKDYGVTKETGAELVGKAHPKSAKPAESMGDGALVENIVEQQEKDIEVATRMPSGALHGKHAELVGALVRLADRLDGEGRREAAERIDRAIGRISRLPFEASLHKEAAFFLPLLVPFVKTLMWGGAAAGAWHMFGTKLTSVRENLAEDIQDVIDTGASVGEDPTLSALSRELRSLLAPHMAKLRRPFPPPGQNEELLRYVGDLDAFAADFAKASAIIKAMTAVPDAWYKFGLGAKSKLVERFSDLEKTLRETRAAAEALAGRVKDAPPEAGQAPEPAAARPEETGNGIAQLQTLLSERGLRVPPSGKLDDATRDALRKLERQIDADLRRDPAMAEILERRNWSVSGALLRPDGTVVGPDVLRRLLALADRTGK